MKRQIDILSAKFVKAGIVVEGEAYKTPTQPIPLSELFVSGQSSEGGPFIVNGETSKAINVEGINVNFISRKLEGSISLNEQELQVLKTSLNQILKLHDDLRSGATIKFMTGFVLE